MLERLAGLVRTARNSANMREGFEATSQMMSLVGCSGEDFEAILRSLGFRKNTIKREVAKAPQPQKSEETTAAEAKPETVATELAQAPAGDGDAQAPAEASLSTEDSTAEAASAAADTPQSETPAANQHEAPAEKPVTDTPSAEAPPTKAATDAKPVAKPDASSDAAAETEEVELTLWRPAPRKPHVKPKPGAKSGRPDHKGKHGKGKQDQSRGHKPRRHPPRQKKADPNSPFAVLAGLKSELTNAQKDKKKPKQTEKAE